MNKTIWLNRIAWSISSLTIVLAFIGWGGGLKWQLLGISLYQIFPLLGLLAFGLMWSHYAVACLRLLLKIERRHLYFYFEATSFLVLISILLHPGLLSYQLWSDGRGLPPISYLNNYLAPQFKGAIVLGSISLMAFLAYELRRFFAKTTWWKYVAWASDIAMLLIIIHALRLGSNLRSGWLKTVWLGYAISLLIFIGYINYTRLNKSKITNSNE